MFTSLLRKPEPAKHSFNLHQMNQLHSEMILLQIYKKYDMFPMLQSLSRLSVKLSQHESRLIKAFHRNQ